MNHGVTNQWTGVEDDHDLAVCTDRAAQYSRHAADLRPDRFDNDLAMTEQLRYAESSQLIAGPDEQQGYVVITQRLNR